MSTSTVSRPGTDLEPERDSRPSETTPLLPHEDNPHKLASTRSKLQKATLIATLSCAGFLNIATTQSVIIILPEISKTLSIPLSSRQWIISSYNIAFGCSLLLLGRIADIYGHRLIFQNGMICSTIINVAIPFAPTGAWFFLLRAFSGLCAAATMPSALGILATMFTDTSERAFAFTMFNAALCLGSVSGYTLGGFTVILLRWQWAFWITAVISALDALATAWLPEMPCDVPKLHGAEGKRYRVDVIGAVLLSYSLVALLMVSSGSLAGSYLDRIGLPALMVSSLLAFIAFIAWQHRLEKSPNWEPLIRISVFNQSQCVASVLLTLAYYACFASFLVFASYFFQDYQGLSTLETTLRFLPTGISGLLMCFVTAWFLSTFRGFYLLLFSVVCVIGSPLLFALDIDPSTTYWAVGFPAMCLCAGIDILAPAVYLIVSGSLPAKEQALGGALIQTCNQIGRPIGLAVATAVQNKVQNRYLRDPMGVPDRDSILRGIRAGQWSIVGFGVLSLLIVVSCFRKLSYVGRSASGTNEDGK